MSLCELLGIDEPEEIIEEVEVKLPTLSPFDFSNSISYDKKDLFADNEDAERQYNSYIVNRAISFSPDMVLFANEMNRLSSIPKRLQFEFLKSVIRKKKRYDGWIKAEKEIDEISLIKEYYNYSNEEARYALSILMPDQIDEIRSRLNKGGLQTKQKRKKLKEKYDE